MGIFRRKDKAAEVEKPAVTEVDTEEARDVETDAAVGEPVTATSDDSADDARTDPAVAADKNADKLARTPRLNSREVDRSKGPFDRTEVDDLEGRVDFGSIAIVPIAEMELRLDVDESGQEITGLTAIVGESACQMQVFAAPKSSGVWDGIRGEIHDNLLSTGGTAKEMVGALGYELHVRMPATGPDGRTTHSAATFVGVDGPRWFLRAVLPGKAAMEDEAAEQMLEFIRGVVVTRGGEPRAPRELLPLRLPENTEPVREYDEAGEELPNPFDRGPEITEIR